ncbi:MAG: hypothetical protein LBT50_08330 [Prevotellaceae bacterium]|jgi:hypothetical protein|nr:hypothetical protein [Prevotellaceae bacterium]
MVYGQNITDASSFGFLPDASGIENTKALQQAADQTGTIRITTPGTYRIAGTVYIGSHTSLVFENGVILQKVNEQGIFTHVLLNKGALTKTYDEHISIEGLTIAVNGIDKGFTEIYGLRGQIAFFYVKDLRIAHFRCEDLESALFCVHVCTFEDLIIDDVIIKGKKDGIHLGCGKRFTIRNCVFRTFDDGIALNAHDYATSNPEMGWIEDGVVENCYDLNAEKTTGFFCRILAGSWIDWKQGMEVQHSDAVVSNGRIYRVQAEPNGKIYQSQTRPVHESGIEVLDSIRWGVVQNEITYTAGVRNVSFRNIFLYKPRIGFSFNFDKGRYSRSYYPGAVVPLQKQFIFENIRVLHDSPVDLISINTPVDVITIIASSFAENGIRFHGEALPGYETTKLNLLGCVFNKQGVMTLINSNVEHKKIVLKTTASIEMQAGFSAKVIEGKGQITVNSDLTGLTK